MPPIQKVIAAFFIAILALVASPSLSTATETTIDKMPVDLETRYALSALPTPLRAAATVYVLDPAKGYLIAKSGTSGLACLVERTGWELNDYRNDIYIPLCYDAAGTNAHFKVIMDAAELRAQGLSAEALKSEIEKRYADKTYGIPSGPGLSYMVSPIMRNIAPPDMKVHTMAMPHFMFYAPNVANKDIGAKPDLANPASLLNPFIDRQGNDQQSYIIQLVGKTEKQDILDGEKQLIEDLCDYRDLLCLEHTMH